MKRIITLLAIAIVITVSSCTPESQDIYGCMNPESENYDQSATIDNASCIMPYEKFIGTYSVTEAYTTTSCGSGNDAYTTIITQGSNNHEIVITNLGGLPDIRFNVDGQDMDGIFEANVPTGIGPLDFSSGSGSLIGDQIFLTYQLSDVLHSNNCGYYNVTATFVKQ